MIMLIVASLPGPTTLAAMRSRIPPRTPLARYSRLSIEELAPLFAAGLSHLQCRELCEAVVGYKLSRLNLYPREIEAVRAWCARRGLAVELSDFGVRTSVRQEGKGGWSNVGARVAPGEALRFCYVSRSRSDARAARDAEADPSFSPREMAALLNIPPCCCDFFMEHKREAMEVYADDYALITLRSTASPPPYPWPVNYLGQYFGFSLIHHFPCSWHCSRTRARALDGLDILREVSPDWARTFTEALPGVVVFENLRAVHFIQAAPRTPGSVAFEPYELRSTNVTALGEALRTSGRLEWATPMEFEVGGVDHRSYSSESETAVLWFG
jgi:hypothetical protein